MRLRFWLFGVLPALLFGGAALLAAPPAAQRLPGATGDLTPVAPRPARPTGMPTPIGLPPDAPPPCGYLLYEDFESGTLGRFVGPWIVSGGRAMVTYTAPGTPCGPPLDPSHPSPLLNWTYFTLTTAAPFQIPQNAQMADLLFDWTWYSPGNDYSFTTELSTDGGVSWQPYTAPNLLAYRGQSLLLRFVAGFAPGDCWILFSYITVDNVQVVYYEPGCPPLPTPTITRSPTITSSPTLTPVTTPTSHAGRFQDVPPPHPFYFYIQCLGGSIISGYDCGGPGEPCRDGDKPYFRPGNNLTRSQAAKILMLTATIYDPVSSTQQTFADVPPTQPFWLFIERMASRGFINGYGCGGPGEPCDPQQRPYFRPGANVTRGQLAKMDANTRGYQDPVSTTQQRFADVPPPHPFWLWVERIAGYNLINGYDCGGPGEPCDSHNRRYFRPGNDITRAQTAKVAMRTFYPNCQTPTPSPTRTATRTATRTPIPSPSLPTRTATPTRTSTSPPLLTETPTGTPTETPTETPVPTETPTETPTGPPGSPTATPTP